MSQEPDDFDRLLGSLAKEGRLQPDPDPEEHPGSGTLFAYHEGKLGPEQRAQVEEHLSLCGRCRDLLVEYKEFAEDPVAEEGESEGVGRVADFGAAADWHRLREKIRAEGGAQRVDAAYEAGTPRGFFRSLRTAYSIAAVLAVAVVGQFLYSANQRRAMNEPELNPPSGRLSGSTRGGDEKVIEVPANEVKTIFFDLLAPELESEGQYRLEIYLDDERIFGPGELKKQEVNDGFFTVAWRSSGLKSGRYEFKVFSVGGGNSELVKQYFFTVVKR